MAQRIRASLAPKVTLEVAPECLNPATIDLPPDDEDITVVVTASIAALNAAIPVVRDRLSSLDHWTSADTDPLTPEGASAAEQSPPVHLFDTVSDLEIVTAAIRRLCTDESAALALNPHQPGLLSRSLSLPPQLAHC